MALFRRTVGLTELALLSKWRAGPTEKGAFLREMPQESWEIYNLRRARTGVPYKWIAPLRFHVVHREGLTCASQKCNLACDWSAH